MQREMTEIANSAIARALAGRAWSRSVRDFMLVSRSWDGLSLWRKQRSSRQVQVRQCKRRERSYRVFHQPTVANLRKAPQRLHDMISNEVAHQDEVNKMLRRPGQTDAFTA